MKILSELGGVLISPRKRQRAQIMREAVRSGLFDPKWYQQAYCRKFSSVQKAFDDYVHKSRFSPIHPSPGFDGETYHRRYMDVYHSQQSPLIHYLEFGRKEGREAGPVMPRWRPRDTLELPTRLSQEAQGLKVALCLHVFYKDFIQRFARALDAFPLEVDVLLTLADGSMEAQALEVFGAHPRVNRVEVRVVPNRGRNFAPWMVEYGETLRNYDLFCHLHSKKSLFSGRDQTQWADYLIEYLLRDPVVVARCLNGFARDPELGVYYPTSFWMLPSWVNHQTMNKPFMRQWQERFGIERIPDFLSYPVGGMFWARPEALDGIVAEGWKYEDFPAEPLPNDGSMLHALERMIGARAEQLGYRQFFYYPPGGQFSTDQSYITANYHGSIHNHVPAIQSHPSVSFDVFDTLVRREYTVPDYAKLKLGKRLAAEGKVDSAEAFVALRNAAEFELRKRAKFKGDIGIADTYSEIGRQLGVDESEAQRWMQREFELDLEMILPKDEMVELFNHLGASGHQLRVISDTYYTAEQVGLMLRKVGVSAPYRLLVSSAEQKRKDNGTLWEKVKEDLKREGITRHLHIGDNVVADSQRPGDLGLATFHILHPMDKWQAMGMPDVLQGSDALNEVEILKWGKLISQMGRNPLIGE